MAYYAHVRNGIIEGVGTCFAVALDMNNIEISEDLYTKYIADKDFLMVTEEGEIQENPDYLTIKEAQRRAYFEARFFPTHLGYVKREVTMKNGNKKDFLTDMLTTLRVGLPIFTYAQPDFTKEVTEADILATQQIEYADEQFIAEWENQFAIDFYGFNPLDVVTNGGNE